QREPYADGDFHLQRFHEAENYLRRVSMYFGREFDANSMIYLLQTWNHFDMAVKFGSLAKAMQPVESEVLVIAATGDNLFPPYLSVDVIKALEANGKSCRYKLIDEDYGHDFFLLGDVITEKLSYPIKSFLGQV
ncbi:MAG: hypothetical protein OEZ59_08830, partial [Deltaproteobacteria bacterium]|nr:hypothetical protein [Deltaproteobacteria bacterium]